MPTAEAREAVEQGFNPRNPAADDMVLCWGERCTGNFGAFFDPMALCRLVVMTDCACMRRHMMAKAN